MAVDGERVDSTSRACASVETWRLRGDEVIAEHDLLAVEEPLEIRLAHGERGHRVRQAVSITMRTPGHDVELAVGFLFTEGIVTSPEQIAGVTSCGAGNVACVKLRPGVAVDLSRLERHFYTSSSCGVCGKASLEAVEVQPREGCLPGEPVVDAAVIRSLPAKLRAAQEVFEQTGGCTPRRCSTPTASCSSSARTSADTTHSTNLSATSSSLSGRRSRRACCW